MKISEFARRCGISVRMLRFYESAGILVPARTPSGYREYDERDIGFVRKAVMLNRAGLALKDIALLRNCLNDEPQNFCSELRGKLADTQARIRQQIDGLHRSEQLIAALLAAEKASGGNEAV